MYRFFAKWRAKRQYIARLEQQAATSEISAKLALNRAKEKRALIEQLTNEAEAIEANIKAESEKPEYQTLQGQEKYEADREKREAEKIVESKRQQAKQEAVDVEEGEKTAKHFISEAANSRLVADKIRAI
jgi:hypothetical protein